jgi:hypothetical protein
MTELRNRTINITCPCTRSESNDAIVVILRREGWRERERASERETPSAMGWEGGNSWHALM